MPEQEFPTAVAEKSDAVKELQKTTLDKAEQKYSPKEAEGRGIAAGKKAKKANGRKVAIEAKAKKAEKRKLAAGAGSEVEVEEDDKQLFRGITRLYISQGTQGTLIANMMNLLAEIEKIKVLSSGGAAGQRSWVILSTEEALPLLQIIKKIPTVKKVSKQGNDIVITLSAA